MTKGSTLAEALKGVLQENNVRVDRAFIARLYEEAACWLKPDDALELSRSVIAGIEKAEENAKAEAIRVSGLSPRDAIGTFVRGSLFSPISYGVAGFGSVVTIYSPPENRALGAIAFGLGAIGASIGGGILAVAREGDRRYAQASQESMKLSLLTMADDLWAKIPEQGKTGVIVQLGSKQITESV